MKKIIITIISLLLMVGCSSKPIENKPEFEGFNILVPKGAPAVSVLKDASSDSLNTYEFVDGSDVLSVELARDDSEYDMIIAPVNLGVKLISSGKSPYKLAGYVTWGNLYLLGTKPLSELGDDKIAAFGEAAVPGKVFKAVLSNKEIKNEVTYFGAVTEAQAELLSGKVNYALIAEPAATATIAKAKQNGLELSIVLDIQSAFENISGNYGYPQAAIFVKEEVYNNYSEEVDSYLNDMESYLNDAKANPESIKPYFDVVSAETIGVPSSELIVKTFSRLNVKYGDGKTSQNDLKYFLDLFNITFDETVFLK